VDEEEDGGEAIEAGAKILLLARLTSQRFQREECKFLVLENAEAKAAPTGLDIWRLKCYACDDTCEITGKRAHYSRESTDSSAMLMQCK